MSGLPPAEEAHTVLVQHCYYCFRVLLARLGGTPPPIKVPFPDVKEKVRLFVSWNIRPTSDSPNHQDLQLRGCLGTFHPQDLLAGLTYFAEQSAFHDHRFEPITLAELPRLECSVSLLSPFEPCKDYLDWKIGVHGVYLIIQTATLYGWRPSDESATARGKYPSGSAKDADELTVTFLPEVSLSQGWSKQETIDKAIRKAGYDGKITESMRRLLRVYRYSSHKATVTWDEFDTWNRLEQDPITRNITMAPGM